MKCKIDGCDRDAMYKGKQLCQMHYFRNMRFGRFGLKELKKFYVNPDGYKWVKAPGHKLAMENSYVFEHRKIVYDIYGDNLPDCEICGKPSNWATSHIDHRDKDPGNNHPDNLRPLCPGCNTWRDRPPAHTFAHCTALTFDGETKTAFEWSCDKRVNCSRPTIVRRKKQGMSDFDALFTPKLTHKNTAIKSSLRLKKRGD